MDDWQGNIFSIKDRAALLLKNEILTDVRFTFSQIGAESEPKVLQAHKLILANASIVFQKMFYGELKENTDKAIEIVGIDWKAFAIMLEYIYTDKVEFENWDIAAGVYDVANKYLLAALAKFCTEFIHSQLKAENALKIFEFASLYEVVELKEAVLEIIREQTLLAFASSDFNEIDINTMLTILEQDQLQANEIDLYDALTSLAAAQGVIGNGNTQTDAASDVPNSTTDVPYTAIDAIENISDKFPKFRQAIKKINFTEMTAEQFSLGPAFSKLLLPEEVSAILVCLVQPSNTKARYPNGFEQQARKKYLPRVFFDITVDDSYIGRILIELRADVVPETTKAFLALCTGRKAFGFKGSRFNRIKENDLWYIGESVDFTSGKKKTYSMDCENFILKHTGCGIVGLCETEKKSFVSDFYITISPKANFDNSNVVIGKVVEGMDILNYLSTFATSTGKPLKKIMIENCNEIKYNEAKKL